MNETLHSNAPPPHGGEVVDLLAERDEQAQLEREAERYPSIVLDEISECDLVCLATGVFSPLRGFMDRQNYERCIEAMRLSDGTLWPIPIVLPVGESERAALAQHRRATLRARDGRPLALLTIEDVFDGDLEHEAVGVYGTADVAHPGVAALRRKAATYVAGAITVFSLPEAPFPDYSLTPAATRRRFAELGWRSVVGFQTRNPVHRAHEYLQKVALEQVDGLLLHPLVGTTKGDDIPAAVRLRCYEVLLARYYPPARALLAVYPAAMRYAGPREAVLHAIARKNYGCTHFIVGRDHAGAGSFYGPFQAQELLNGLQDELGITILSFADAFWCGACEAMATNRTCPHGEAMRFTLSGTRLREMLRRGERPPSEIVRPEVADVLIEALAGDQPPVQPTVTA